MIATARARFMMRIHVLVKGAFTIGANATDMTARFIVIGE